MRMQRAKQAFEDFTGHKAHKVARVKLDNKNVNAWKLGRAVGVAYEATRDGKKAQYFHKFNSRASPDLVARDDGKRLYFAGGRYTVTDRGIEDMPYAFVVNPSSRRRKQRRKHLAMASPRRRRRRRTHVVSYRTNPRPARRYHRRRSRSVMRYRANPAPRRHYRRRRTMRFRRNPIGGGLSFKTMLFPAVMIGAGAVGSELVMGYLPLPVPMHNRMSCGWASLSRR